MSTTESKPTTIVVPANDWKKLRLIKHLARISIGFVWIWEGLVPKMLFPSALQVDMVQRSGWWWGSAEATLYWLGAAMIVAGLILVSGFMERLAVAVATLAVLVLMVLVIGNYPQALYDPFGGLPKDACLFICAALVWWWPKPPLK